MRKLTPEQHATREFIAQGLLKAAMLLRLRPVPGPSGRPGTPPRQRKKRSDFDGPTGHSVKSFLRAQRTGWRPL